METRRTDPSDWPLLTRFYGIPPSELAKLSRALLSLYRKAVPAIMAQEMIAAMAVADFPHMDQSDREMRHKDLLEEIGIDRDEQRPTTPGSSADIMALAGMGITVELPTKKTEEEAE
jgi:hypothetical protein